MQNASTKYKSHLSSLQISPVMTLTSIEDAVHRYKATVTTGSWRNSGTSATVSMKLYGTENSSGVIKLATSYDDNRKPFRRGNTDNFLFSVGQPLGSLVKLQVGHDSSGEDPSWFLNEISITDIEENFRWIFPCYRWLALERDDGCITMELYASNDRKHHSFKHKFNSARMSGLTNNHMWFSVATKEPRDFFTRVQRVTCCCFFFLWGMLISAMFYLVGNADNTPTIQVGPFKMTARELIVSIFTALISFPPSFLVVFMFRNSRRSRVANEKGSGNDGNKRFILPHFCIYIAWFICVVGSLSSAVFVILYSFQWRGEISSRWLSSIFLTTIEDVFVSQPLKIVVVSVLLALRFARKRSQHERQDHELSKEANSFNSDNSQELFNMPKETTERQRKYRVTERKANTFIRDTVFSCVFFILLAFVCYGGKSEHRYPMAKATRDAFKKLHKVRASL